MSWIRMDYQLSETTGAYGEPLRACTWAVVISREGLTDLPLICTTSGLPVYTSNVVEIHHFNEKSKIAGKPDIGNIDIVVTDTVAPPIAQAFWTWYTYVYDPVTGQVGYASDYKTRGYLMQYDTRGAFMREWECHNLWPTSYNPGSLDYSSDAPLQITVSLACDRAVPAFNGVAATVSPQLPI